MTVGESIVALEEAIEVMRAVWTPQGDIRIAGKYCSMMGAQGGPSPAHDVEIWVGAFKPRMLSLTGRLADGWLPTSVAAMPNQLTAMNRIIDDSAVQGDIAGLWAAVNLVDDTLLSHLSYEERELVEPPARLDVR
jgi:alkanesulfonate monooxygenase SsuD/methylene tetrahydromethanopterin reductase-like flavin-dependent oxidoreductase (luciferase family)